MATILDKDDTPSHLFDIAELDFSSDLFVDRVDGPWFRLGAWTITQQRDKRGIESVISRQSLLLPPNCFIDIFDKLEYVGNVLHDLGKPGGSVLHNGDKKEYRYISCYQFEFPFTSTAGEPLVFVHSSTQGVQLFINPDLWLFFELEERSPRSGIWWDPRRGVDALLRRAIDQDTLEVVEIRVDYLLKYLQARQMSLLVGHYRHLHLFEPTDDAVATFVKGDVTVGSPEKGVKAIFQNWGLRQDIFSTQPFLQRRLHLWFEIKPPEIDVNDPWTDQPSFDPYTFTLPTRCGPVAPARWRNLRSSEGHTFDGVTCDFMDYIYFQQEVLAKYEGSSGFDIEDNGSVRCQHYWGLVRSTARIGNELLATAIGDFAEGVPFEEWPHWKQYSVEPPSFETRDALAQEQTVPNAVNSVVKELQTLNDCFAALAFSLGISNLDPLWNGSLDSLAGRQLKWVYPARADDDEFLKRATLLSTLVIEALKPASLRKLLSTLGKDLHMNDDNPPAPLGSRNLLQRLTLVAILIKDVQPRATKIPILVRQAEASEINANQTDLQAGLKQLYERIRDDFAPLAFLYDLRTFGGLAHVPNKTGVSAATTKLGLPKENWHRTDYLHLLNLVKESIHQVSEYFRDASQAPIKKPKSTGT